MAELARRFGGAPRARSIQLGAIRSLEAIARENLREGCITETWGALVGRHQARRAADPVVRRAFRGVARDEFRHAALSWDLHAWLRPRLSPSSREQLRADGEARLAELQTSLGADQTPELERELGLPAPKQARLLFGTLRERLWSDLLA
jgi:hypothetical protein